MTKALLLLSGGLDSMLAGKILGELGVEISALNFTSPFCRCTPKGAGCSAASAAAKNLGIPLKTFAKGEDYLAIVKHPPHGSGSGVNPCIDCRIFTFRRAKIEMEKSGADFIATGEVLGQRPMSQKRNPLMLIERESGLTGKIVRPLSAKLLPPSDAEKSGLIDREKLLAIQGRSRRDQIDLAESLTLGDYPCPAGGCLLTDQKFAVKFRELLRVNPDFDMADARLLAVGRHFRLPTGEKVVVGRNEAENEKIAAMARDGDIVGAFPAISSPTVLLRPDRANAKDFLEAERIVSVGASIALNYCKSGEVAEFVGEKIIDGRREKISLTAHRISADEIEKMRIVQNAD